MHAKEQVVMTRNDAARLHFWRAFVRLLLEAFSQNTMQFTILITTSEESIVDEKTVNVFTKGYEVSKKLGRYNPFASDCWSLSVILNMTPDSDYPFTLSRELICYLNCS